MRSIIRILTWVIRTFIIVVPCILLSIIFSRNPQSFESFVKLAELLISWPIVVVFLAMVILTRFKGAIADLLQNIRSVSFPGGNVQMQPVGPSDAASSEEQTQIREYIATLQQSRDDLQKQLSDEQYSSYMWKFAYLNLFYVPITKEILHWFSITLPLSIQDFHLIWQPRIPDSTYREIILNALIYFQMLQVQNATLSVTLEGEYFLQYVGLKANTPKGTQ